MNGVKWNQDQLFWKQWSNIVYTFWHKCVHNSWLFLWKITKIILSLLNEMFNSLTNSFNSHLKDLYPLQNIIWIWHFMLYTVISCLYVTNPDLMHELTTIHAMLKWYFRFTYIHLYTSRDINDQKLNKFLVFNAAVKSEFKKIY